MGCIIVTSGGLPEPEQPTNIRIRRNLLISSWPCVRCPNGFCKATSPPRAHDFVRDQHRRLLQSSLPPASITFRRQNRVDPISENDRSARWCSGCWPPDKQSNNRGEFVAAPATDAGRRIGEVTWTEPASAQSRSRIRSSRRTEGELKWDVRSRARFGRFVLARTCSRSGPATTSMFGSTDWRRVWPPTPQSETPIGKRLSGLGVGRGCSSNA